MNSWCKRTPGAALPPMIRCGLAPCEGMRQQEVMKTSITWSPAAGMNVVGTVKLIARCAEEGGFLRAESQAVAPVLEISLQIAKARSREARRKSARADAG